MTNPAGPFGTSRRPGFPVPPRGEVIANYDTYEAAQDAVDKLAHADFQVRSASIVGNDLKSVERVTGRLSWGRAAGAGAASGLWLGLFFGLVFGRRRKSWFTAHSPGPASSIATSSMVASPEPSASVTRRPSTSARIRVSLARCSKRRTLMRPVVMTWPEPTDTTRPMERNTR